MAEPLCLLSGLGTQPSHKGHSQDTRRVCHVCARTKMADRPWALSQNWGKIYALCKADDWTDLFHLAEARTQGLDMPEISADTLNRFVVVAIHF